MKREWDVSLRDGREVIVDGNYDERDPMANVIAILTDATDDQDRDLMVGAPALAEALECLMPGVCARAPYRTLGTDGACGECSGCIAFAALRAVGLPSFKPGRHHFVSCDCGRPPVKHLYDPRICPAPTLEQP